MSPRVPVALQNLFVHNKEENIDELLQVDSPTKAVRRKSIDKSGKKTPGIQAPRISTLARDRGDSAAIASQKAMKAKGQSTTRIDDNSPQAFLDKALASRGYSTKKYNSLEGAYYNTSSPYQQASYGIQVKKAINTSDASLLRRLLDAGISPNPCNAWGESMIHTVCRRGDAKLLRIFLESGASVKVSDDFGRTPLHDAFWLPDPAFEAVELLLERDRNLVHLLDCRGCSPLNYVSKKNYEVWINFLKSRLDRFWPKRDASLEGPERAPKLTTKNPHTAPIPDPSRCLPLEIARQLANGQLKPEDVMEMDATETEYEDDDENSDDDDYDDSMSDSDYSDSEASDESELSDIDMDEMTEICLRAGGPMAVARRCFGKTSMEPRGMHKDA